MIALVVAVLVVRRIPARNDPAESERGRATAPDAPPDAAPLESPRELAARDAIIEYADEFLDLDAYPDYGPMGMQVAGAADVQKIACGVSASRELFERAAARGAQLVLVHHGLFWNNEPRVVDDRMKARLKALFDADLTLAAYHLALDAHPELGNNALLARQAGRLGRVLASRRSASADASRRRRPSSRSRSGSAESLEREPLVFAHGPEAVERVADRHRRRGRQPRGRRARGLRPVPDGRAARSRACTRRASSASTSSPPATTRRSAWACRRSPHT